MLEVNQLNHGTNTRLTRVLRDPPHFTCVSPCWPAAEASLGTAVMIFPGVPVVITLVVRIVIGVFMPALLVTPVGEKKTHRLLL